MFSEIITFSVVSNQVDSVQNKLFYRVLIILYKRHVCCCISKRESTCLRNKID